MAPLKIVTAGSSSVTRKPERGILNLAINGEGSTRETVSQKVTETSNELTQLFRELSPRTESSAPTADATVVSYSSTSLRTWRWNVSNEVSAFRNQEFRGSLSLVAVFRDFAKMSEVAGKLVGYPNVDITSIGWELTDATKKALSSESRKEAIRDAVQKASDYTEVIGREVAAVEIIDMGDSAFSVLARSYPSPFGWPSGALFGGRPGAGEISGKGTSSLFGNPSSTPTPEPNAPLDLTPQEIQFSSSVKVIFESAEGV